MHQHASACVNMQHHDPTLASTCIINHQQNRMYTSTSCWQRLSARQGTAWPLHPTRRRGLLWQRALLNSRHRNTNLGKNHEQSLANASGKDCVRKHWHVRTWQNVAEQNTVWTQRRAFAVEASGNPGDGGNPAGDSAVTSAGRKWKKSEPAMAIYTCMSPTQEQKTPQYNELTKNTYDDLSLLKPGQINILKDLQSISKLSYVKIPSTNRKTVSRSLHIFAETKQSTNFKHYMNSDASTCISMHRHATSWSNISINMHQ